MRLLELNILNLASIAEARIDFCSPELAESPVFLITGDTGVGKSTILDAICLALYNKVPRMVSVNTRKGDDSFENEEERSNTPYQLLRKGTGETMIKLRFTGLDDKEYEAHWGIYRARKKASGQLQEGKMDLTLRRLERDAEGNVVKETEIRRTRRNMEEVTESVIGLNYNQFCRTTMLAQGEFTTFLKSDGQEKSKILAKVTDRTDFMEIGRGIHAIAAAKKEACGALRQRMETLRLLDDDELSRLRESLREKEETLSRLRKEEDALSGKLKWMETADALAETHGKYMREIDSLRDDTASVCMRLLLSARKTGEKRDALVAAVAADRAALGSLAGRRAVIDNADAVRDLLDGIIGNRREMSRLESSVARRAREIAACEKKLEESKREVTERESALESIRGERDRLRMELDSRNLGRLAGEITELNARKSMLGKLSADLRSLLDAERDLGELKAEHETESLAHKEKERRRDALLAGLDKVRKDAEDAEKRASEIELTVSETAGELRKMLTPGCRCPVCNSIVETVAAFDAVAENGRLKAARAEAAEKRGDYDAESAEIAELNGVLATEKKSIDARKRKADAEETRLKGVRAKLLERLTDEDPKLGLSEESVSVVDGRERECGEEIAARNRLVEEARPIAAALRAEERKHAEAEEGLKTVQAAYNKANMTIGSLKSVSESETARISECAGEVDRQFCQILETDGIEAFPYVRPDQSERFRSLLSGLVALRERLETRLGNALRDMDEAGRSIEAMENSVAALRERFPELSERHVEEEEEPGDSPEQLCRKADAVLSRLDWLEKELRQLAAGMGEHERLKPDLGEDETRATLAAGQVRLREEQTAVSTERGALMQQIEADGENRRRVGTLKEEYDAAMADYNCWAEFDRQLGSADGDKFNRIAQSYILADLLRRANVYLEQLSDRYRLSGDPGTYRINILDLRQGGACRSAHTSSGGESFLISLALALALGDMGPGLSVDPLFIDEGFGTLSDAPLQRAISLLGTLREKIGRRVGIISHVKALRDAVPVQLRLSSDPRTGATAIRTVLS